MSNTSDSASSRPISLSSLGSGSSVRPPPAYAYSHLDRSPARNPMALDDRPRIPPPINLRSASLQPRSSTGELKIHVHSWATFLVRPPRPLDLLPVESGGAEREPPNEDTVLSGAIEVTMKERKKVQAISVGVQSVCRLHMGKERGWEDDGIFERGVEVLGGGGEDGIWLEKGSQSFQFSILLPATLATSDWHAFGRVSYMITARVQGIPYTSFSSIFKAITPPAFEHTYAADFERVMARSEKTAAERSKRPSSRDNSVPRNSGSKSRDNIATVANSSLNEDYDVDDSGSHGQGLYTRRHSHLPIDESSRGRLKWHKPGSSGSDKIDKTDWMKGDLVASRELLVHAVSPVTGGVTSLDLRKEGFVDGLGSWTLSASADVFSIASVILLSINIPAPSASTTIFLVRLLLSQSYSITSPRTPNQPPHLPEDPKQHVFYQIGFAHPKSGNHPGPEYEALWRGHEAGGKGGLEGEDQGWKVRAVARMPNHDKIRPATHSGTISPLRVSHEMILQVYYSVHGESARGQKIDGPGQLRMMSIIIPTHLPSCHCLSDNLLLPTYDPCVCHNYEIDSIISSPPNVKNWCMCGKSFAELGEAAMKRMAAAEQSDLEERQRHEEMSRQSRTASHKDLQSQREAVNQDGSI
ncbi:hypothetical protein C343_03784 [Cryptococcus neoformans C23]|uniref:Uncharacterized protein n=1 Tax=Cryptococcus neoformans (strain H99 / ATCC 208821 / CBS 10515 / FGSC 9487) TaxID=235443 RepID=J9VN46_CRYN9|nr:hypothetical protein CNAG_02141 [Cryptococcus neoformans var. grubii H99]AUB25513.1 hypothetical protein CKF44_02141 [Cryptococcus neoformans var. grubii]OWZ31087.1 hypothetical protein C347_03846 [Cryptococcus neoformans var. grubii AD2-60a]OWZ40949.1 hypothetical protein C353_03693 [Cryptococcus neoformans var. grubii AD1-83a]OWZ43188.1 hypothetical protein C343_03784 [Cryptococcus neoformans var. grubii C23]OXC84208.1 hypothetical protein C344_03543 [Cryptococcus neoformans var. grubii A|eukprot:XP_012049841.1 hypothetical protein CNAG_02141 [Cryptococcus neoformans var. grubii H99]